MPTRNVVLTTHHERIIEALVASGRYQNASEVLRDGLRLVEERIAREAAKLAKLRDAIGRGDADLEEGRYQEFESPDALARYLREMSERVIAEAVK